MKQLEISHVCARQVFDSRGTPTVEAEVTLENGVRASAAVPSGASTGKYEACELRDGGDAYGGKGVLNAVENVNGPINRLLRGQSAFDQQAIDAAMVRLDGSDTKSALGANATLAVSLAAARAAAAALGLEPFEYIGGINACMLPTPMMNILNGGAHASNNVDIQEFMIMPTGAESFDQAMRMGVEVYHSLGKALRQRGLSTAVGDEGGFAPDLADDVQALELLVEAIERAGYRPGEDVRIALDVAASEWADGSGSYVFPKRGTRMGRQELIAHYADLCGRFPIVSIEDPLSEDDFEGFALITRELGDIVQIVGDDLFVTNPERLAIGIEQNAANAILVKPNQIGTLTETITAVRLARLNGFGTILSHRSGETEDTSLADIAVGLNAGQIKTGAPARTDRVCKYNRLLKIERLLRGAALYAGLPTLDLRACFSRM